MGAFAILAFILTGIYIAYMTCMVFMDIYGDKNKKKKDDESESIPADDMFEDEDVQPVVVRENEDGSGFTLTGGDVPKQALEQEATPLQQESRQPEEKSEVYDDFNHIEQEQSSIIQAVMQAFKSAARIIGSNDMIGKATLL